MPINAHPEYIAAEKEYLAAQTLEDRIEKLKKMISLAPGHKGAENLRAQLKTRMKKLIEQQDKQKKSGSKSSKQGIRKEEMQAAIVGFTNSGKSSLITALTNQKPEIADYEFTTKTPVVGMMPYSGTNIQLIDVPAFESEYYDKGVVNTADTIIILVTELNQIKEIKEDLDKAKGNQLIAFNKIDLLSGDEKRKISENLKSKKYNFVLISPKTKENLDEIKDKLFLSFDKIRVYTKEPDKEKSKKPVVLEKNSTIKDVAEKILHGFSNNVKESRIWGPSAKFAGQKVGLQHKLKDNDIVEFRTR